MHAELPPEEVGERIAAIRHARRMTQIELARASAYALASIKAIERGARIPSHTGLEAIADALGVDPSRLTTDARHDSRVRTALPLISAAIAGYDIPMDPPNRVLPELREAIDTAVKWRVGAQYTLIAKAAPSLLGDALSTLHSSEGAAKQDAARLLAAAARSADAVAYKYGSLDLSARLVELMRWAAQQADDPLLDASTAYVRTEVFFAARAHSAGLKALERAIDAGPAPAEVRPAAARGALHMRAAVIAGRAGDASAADLHLAEARRLGDLVPEGTYDGTAFGPDSVRTHEVSVAVSLGQEHVDRALTVAREWTPPDSLPAERQSGFWIELARAQLWAGRADDSFESLKVARVIAPQHTREHPWARETAGTLRRLKRADAETLTNFAEWVGAI
ncbi:helix-turn-helix domain-containing protein [Streptomyces fagopyri]|uniref:helix-turn-helix domain-containing protein n=1 Tax=Streptomyces fagopyri TaxID=2662397 RepID=UPI00369D463A